MKAEILSIGTEIPAGEIVDTNAAYIASQLPALGIDLYFKAVVGDNMERLTETIGRARERSDIVICTGGLGPTEDDLRARRSAPSLGEEPHVDRGRLRRICARSSSGAATRCRNATSSSAGSSRRPERSPTRAARAGLVGGARRQDHRRHARPADRDDTDVGEGSRAGTVAPQPRLRSDHAHSQDRRHREGTVDEMVSTQLKSDNPTSASTHAPMACTCAWRRKRRLRRRRGG